jgi:thiamine kinase
MAVNAEPVLEAVFSAGHTNRNFLVRYGGLRMVVRVPDAEQSLFGIDRVVEQQVLAAVAPVGLCPRVLHCEPDTGILVTEYLSSRPLRVDGPRADRNIDRLAELLSRLHRVQADVPPVRLADRIRHYLRASSRAPGPTRRQARRWADACSPVLEQYMRSRRAPVLCHNDLVAANILDAGSALYLIDWEYAGLGDPFFDLAAVADEHGFGQLDRERLLLAYGEPGPDAHLSLYQARVIHRLLSILWYLVRNDGTRNADALSAALARHEQALQVLLTDGPDV